ncbi:MAG: hypothetical protein EOP64_02890 [Sphingomonas sp.]|nr:MAG: hypothetical protein EOP64_02890 [Sphingomonas sp.]
MTDPIKPTATTKQPNLYTEHQNEGDARRPSDTLIGAHRAPRAKMPRSESRLLPKGSQIAQA